MCLRDPAAESALGLTLSAFDPDVGTVLRLVITELPAAGTLYDNGTAVAAANHVLSTPFVSLPGVRPYPVPPLRILLVHFQCSSAFALKLS